MKDSLSLPILLNDIQEVKRLIADGEDINFQDKFGKTALMFAIFNNKPDVVKVLVEAGANLNLKDKWGQTALDYAKRDNHTKIIELLTNSKKPKEGKAVSQTSKVIQITTNEKQGDLITTALCEDGSIWRYDQEWICILEPIEPKTESESDIKNNIKYIEDKVKAIKEEAIITTQDKTIMIYLPEAENHHNIKNIIKSEIDYLCQSIGYQFQFLSL